MRGIGGERKKGRRSGGRKSKARTDLNLVNCQREGLRHQIPGENRGPSYLLALQPAANHLYLIVRHKLYEDQRGIWLQSLLTPLNWCPCFEGEYGRVLETCHMFFGGHGLHCSLSLVSIRTPSHIDKPCVLLE